MQTPFEALCDLIRAVARALEELPGAQAPDPLQARQAFFRAAHAGRCPACGSVHATLRGLRRVHCADCQRTSSLTARTPWHGVRLALHVRVAAVWHVHVDTETISAAAFARRHQIDDDTALALFHDARRALVHAAVQTASATKRVLGGQSPRNRATVAIAVDDDGVLTANHADDAAPIDERPPAETALWLGRLHAWIVDVFRGVTRRFLDLYLAEFAARWRRARALELRLRSRADTPRAVFA